MEDNELLAELLKEEQQAFTGWDFSYLNGRWESSVIPWDYQKIVLYYLKDNMNLLDIGTGGGEFLLTLKHPYKLTSVTEAYPPNIKLCQDRLKPKGIQVYPIKDDNILMNILENNYDIVINRHESYNEKEVYKVLKTNGMFITEQVGAYNNKDLATFFDPSRQDQFPKMTLSKSVERLIKAGFEIVYQSEAYNETKFFDLGAVAYYANIIKWEFLNFNVKSNINKFKELQIILKKDGYIKSTGHRFIIVAKKIVHFNNLES